MVLRVASPTALAKYGFGGSIGLLMMGWASQAYLWYGYQRANPAVGSVSTTPGFELELAVLFVVGSTIAFTSFSRGLEDALDGEG